MKGGTAPTPPMGRTTGKSIGAAGSRPAGVPPPAWSTSAGTAPWHGPPPGSAHPSAPPPST